MIKKIRWVIRYPGQYEKELIKIGNAYILNTAHRTYQCMGCVTDDVKRFKREFFHNPSYKAPIEYIYEIHTEKRIFKISEYR